MYRDEHGRYSAEAAEFEESILKELRKLWYEGLDKGFTPEEVSTSMHSCVSELISSYYVTQHVAATNPRKPMVATFWYAEDSFFKTARHSMEIIGCLADGIDQTGQTCEELKWKIPEDKAYFYNEGYPGKVIYNGIKRVYEVHAPERLLSNITFQKLVYEEFYLPENTEFVVDDNI